MSIGNGCWRCGRSGLISRLVYGDYALVDEADERVFVYTRSM